MWMRIHLKLSPRMHFKTTTPMIFELKQNNTTRGHKLKLFKKRCNLNIRKIIFIFSDNFHVIDSATIRTSIWTNIKHYYYYYYFDRSWMKPLLYTIIVGEYPSWIHKIQIIVLANKFEEIKNFLEFRKINYVPFPLFSPRVSLIKSPMGKHFIIRIICK